MKKCFAVLILSLSLFSGDCFAQCFRRSTCVPVSHHVPFHHKKVVVEPVVATVLVPVLIPAFQYQYSPPICAPAAYHQQQPYQQNPYASNDHIKELARALLEEMNKLSSPEEDGPPVVTGPYASNQHNPTPVSNLKPDFKTVAYRAMIRTCAACHTGVGSKGEAVIFNQPRVLNVEAPWRSIKREIERGVMPPKQSQYKLTAEEIEAIKAFADSHIK